MYYGRWKSVIIAKYYSVSTLWMASVMDQQ